MIKKLNLGLFAVGFSGTMGSRLFISETLPITIDSEVIGVKETSDKGGTPNQVNVTTIKDTIDKNVDGTQQSTENSYTFFLDDRTTQAQMDLSNKEVYIYEEIEDTSKSLDKIGSGVVYKGKLGALTMAGQSSNTERTFTQTATLVSDEYFLATPTDDPDTGEQVFSYRGLSTTNIVSDF